MRHVTLAVGTVVAALAAGCITTAISAASPPSSVKENPAPVAKAQVGDPEDPATWVLPVQTYMPSSRQARGVTATRDEMMDACMEEAGFPQWEPSPSLPTLGGDNDMDARYGINDLDQARNFGYHPDPEAQKAYDDAINADIAGNATTDQKSLLDCVTRTNQSAPRVSTPELIDRIGGNSWKEAQETPAVRKVFADWSACMKDKGYTYAEPMDANDDPAWAASEPGKASARERAVAVADVECRDEHHVEKTWFDAETLIQQHDIQQHSADLDKLRNAMQDAVNRAESAR